MQATDPLGLLAHTCEAANMGKAIAPSGGCGGGNPAGDMCYFNFFFTGYCFPSTGPLVVSSVNPNSDQGGAGTAPIQTTNPSGPTCVSAALLNSYLSDTPLAGEGQDLYNAGEQYDVNPALVVAIADAESTFGENTNTHWGLYNAWGWGNSSTARPIAQSWTSWQQGIYKVTWQLSNYNYMGARPPLTTAAAIYGRWCQSGDCAGGLKKIGQVLKDLGVNPASLRFKACAGGQND